MPVNLSAIPDKAERTPPPVVKRWFAVLFLLITLFGAATLYFWPVDWPSRTALFWHCSLTLPVLLWAAVFGVRIVFWLMTQWQADGWDEERQWDLNREIQRGQRSLSVISTVIQLPHVVAPETLAEQLLLPNAISLPTKKMHDAGVIFQSRFSYDVSTLFLRVEYKIKMLLADVSLQAALKSLVPDVFVYISDMHLLKQHEIECICQVVNASLDRNVAVSLKEVNGLTDIDDWLDNKPEEASMLVISLNLKIDDEPGSGEAAVALLLQFDNNLKSDSKIKARIHRPELSVSTELSALKISLERALLWGNVTTMDIPHIWLSGMGMGNKSRMIFSKTDMEFPCANITTQPCDIDISLGQTNVAAPWLAIAIAALNTNRTHSPQLIMNSALDGEDVWFMIVNI